MRMPLIQPSSPAKSPVGPKLPKPIPPLDTAEMESPTESSRSLPPVMIRTAPMRIVRTNITKTISAERITLSSTTRPSTFTE